MCTQKNATVCSIGSCLICLAPYPRKWIISCPGSSQGGLCEPLFWHGLISQASFPFFLFPSFLPSHPSTPSASRLIYLLDFWHDLSQRKSKQVLSWGHVLEIHLAGVFSFRSVVSWFILEGYRIDWNDQPTSSSCSEFYHYLITRNLSSHIHLGKVYLLAEPEFSPGLRLRLAQTQVVFGGLCRFSNKM